MRFTFWNFNDIVDGASELIGVGTGPKRCENPVAFAGGLRILVEDAVKLVGDAMGRATEGAIEI
eukprot:5340544-Pyramimonas_sp.AAC.1